MMFGLTFKAKQVTAQVADPSGALDGGQTPDRLGPVGFITGTRVASNLGWTAVDVLAPGDKVLTFDNGMQPITDIQHKTLWTDPAHPAPKTHWPMHIPRGALENRLDMTLMPGQGVLIESEAVVDALGDPFAIVPARALSGYRGITPLVPSAPHEVIELSFATDEVVYAEGGLLAYCPRTCCMVQDDVHAMDTLYNVMDLQGAMSLAEDLKARPLPQLIP